MESERVWEVETNNLERFFGTLKREWPSREHCKTHEEARTAIFESIEAFSNRGRKHATLGYLSPVQFEIVQGCLFRFLCAPNRDNNISPKPALVQIRWNSSDEKP
jgi:hypothetical protein